MSLNYGKVSDLLVFDLINRDNPGLPIPVSDSNVIVEKITTVQPSAATNNRNTQARLRGVQGAGYRDSITLYYDRLKMESIYTSLLSKLVLTMPNSVSTYADMLPTINDALGLGLTASDLAAPTTALGLGRVPVSVTLTMATNCPCFTGSLTLMWQRGATGIYPDSGPGSKTMIMGDMNEGYFGMVTQQELGKGTDIFAAFAEGKSLGNAVGLDTSDLFWLKFALDGKICYFPSRNIGASVVWNDLAKYGATLGDAQSPIVFKAGDGTNLFAQLRLPNVSAKDTLVTPNRGDATSDPIRLLNKVHKQSYGNGAWDELTTINTSEYFWFFNRRSDVADNPAIISQFNMASVSSQAVTREYTWRPFLILVDGKMYLVPVRNVVGKMVTTLAKLPVLLDRNPDPKMLVRMYDVSGTQYRTIKPLSVQQQNPSLLLAPANVRATRTLQPLSASVTITITQKINLAQTNGELAGFK